MTPDPTDLSPFFEGSRAARGTFAYAVINLNTAAKALVRAMAVPPVQRLANRLPRSTWLSLLVLVASAYVAAAVRWGS